MDFLSGKVQIFLGPQENGAADSPEDVIIKFIDDAQFSLDLAVQEIDNPRIAAALGRASRRKIPNHATRLIKVRVVTEGDYLLEEKPDKGTYATNRTLLSDMLAGAVDAKIDFNPKIFHHKFVIRDAQKPRAAVLTGSCNFTDTDTHRNLNHVAIFHHDGIVFAYQTEFDQLREGIFGARSPKLTTVDPPTFLIDGTRISILFSPDHSPELQLVKEIQTAQQSAHLLIFTFTKTSAIAGALQASLLAPGFTVKGVLDSMQSSQAWSPHAMLIQAGATLRKDKLPNQGKVHHKLLVLDNQVAIGGSFNFTKPANVENDENLFIIRNAAIAQHLRAEVDRVFQHLASNFV